MSHNRPKKSHKPALSKEQQQLISEIKTFCESRTEGDVIKTASALLKKLTAQGLDNDKFYHVAIHCRHLLSLAKKCSLSNNIDTFIERAPTVIKIFNSELAKHHGENKKVLWETFGFLTVKSLNEAFLHIFNYLVGELLAKKEDKDCSTHIALYISVMVRGVTGSQIDRVVALRPKGSRVPDIAGHVNIFMWMIDIYNTINFSTTAEITTLNDLLTKSIPPSWHEECFPSYYYKCVLSTIIHHLVRVRDAATTRRLEPTEKSESDFNTQLIMNNLMLIRDCLAKNKVTASEIVNQNHLLQATMVLVRLVLLTCGSTESFKRNGIKIIDDIINFSAAHLSKDDWRFQAMFHQLKLNQAELYYSQKKEINRFVESAYHGLKKLQEDKEAQQDYTVHLTLAWTGILYACQQIKNRHKKITRELEPHDSANRFTKELVDENNTFELSNSIINIPEIANILNNMASSYRFLNEHENQQETYQLILMPFSTFEQEISESLFPFIKSIPLELEKIKKYLAADQQPTIQKHRAIEEQLNSLKQTCLLFDLSFSHFAHHPQYFLAANNSTEYFDGLHKKLAIVITLVENEIKTIKNIMQEKLDTQVMTSNKNAADLTAKEEKEKEKRRKKQEEFYEKMKKQVDMLNADECSAKDDDVEVDVDDNTHSTYIITQDDTQSTEVNEIKRAQALLNNKNHDEAYTQFEKILDDDTSSDFKLESLDGMLMCKTALIRYCTNLFDKIANDPHSVSPNESRKCYAKIAKFFNENRDEDKKDKNYQVLLKQRQALLANPSDQIDAALWAQKKIESQITIDNLIAAWIQCQQSKKNAELQMNMTEDTLKLILGLKQLKIKNPDAEKYIMTVGMDYYFHQKEESSQMSKEEFAQWLPQAQKCYQIGSTEYIRIGKDKIRQGKKLSVYADHKTSFKKYAPTFELNLEKRKIDDRIPAKAIHFTGLTSDKLLNLLTGNALLQPEIQKATKEWLEKNSHQPFSPGAAYEFLCFWLISPDIVNRFKLLKNPDLINYLLANSEEEKASLAKDDPAIIDYFTKIGEQLKINSSPNYEIAFAHLCFGLSHSYPLSRLKDNVIERTSIDLPISRICRILGLSSSCKNIVFALVSGKIALTLSSISRRDSTIELLRDTVLRKIRTLLDTADISQYPLYLYAQGSDLLQQVITGKPSPDHITLVTNLDPSQYGFTCESKKNEQIFHRKLENGTIDSSVSIFINHETSFKPHGDLTIDHLAYDYLLRQLIYFNENTSIDLRERKIHFFVPFNPKNAAQLLTYLAVKNKYDNYGFELSDIDKIKLDTYLATIESQQSLFLPSIYTLDHQHRTSVLFAADKLPKHHSQDTAKEVILSRMIDLFTMGEAVRSFTAAVNTKLIGTLFRILRAALPFQEDTLENIIRELSEVDQTFVSLKQGMRMINQAVEVKLSDNLKKERWTTINAIIIHHSLWQIGMHIDEALSKSYSNLDPEIKIALKKRISSNTLAEGVITATTTAVQAQTIRLNNQPMDASPGLSNISIFSNNEKTAALFQVKNRERASSTNSYFDRLNYNKKHQADKTQKRNIKDENLNEIFCQNSKKFTKSH